MCRIIPLAVVLCFDFLVDPATAFSLPPIQPASSVKTKRSHYASRLDPEPSNDEGLSMFDLIVGTHFETVADEVAEVGGDPDFILNDDGVHEDDDDIIR
jgi:hypothetical protein